MKNAFIPTKTMLDNLEDIKAEITTFAILQGLETNCHDDYFYILTDGKMLGNYLFEGYTDKTILDYNEKVKYPDTISGVRLGIYYSEKDPNWHILEKVPNSPELYLAVYHEYITDLAPKSLQKKLENLYEKGKLKKTGKSYTGATLELPVMEYKQKRYVRFPISEKLSKNIISIISKDTYVCEQNFYWLEVKPLEFIINKRNNLALTKKIIYATLTETISNDLLATILNEITGTKEEVRENLQDKSDITRLLNEIKKLIKNDEYLAKKIIAEVNQILQDYNKRIRKLKENIQQNPSLTLVLETKETVKIDLIIKLTNIINKLKKYQEENKEYYQIIAMLDYYLEIINGKFPDNEKLNIELSYDLYEIVLVLNTLKDKDKEEIREKLASIIKKKRIAIRKKQISEINEIEYEGEPLNFNNREELILEIRKLIHPILIALDNKIKSSVMEEEITTGIKNIIAGLYVKTNNDYISSHLFIINQLVNNLQIILKEMPNKNDYQLILTEILNLEIDYSQNILIIIKELQKRIIALYKLKLEIELYLKEQKSYDAFIYKLTP